jgi:hypothetical protein
MKTPILPGSSYKLPDGRIVRLVSCDGISAVVRYMNGPGEETLTVCHVDDRYRVLPKTYFKNRVTRQVMRPGHPRWYEFLKRLRGPEGCNFRETKLGRVTWRCRGGRDKSLAIAILQRIGDIDVERSLEYFERNSGYCDCEILFNVAHQRAPT